jgi:hypothetical protein
MDVVDIVSSKNAPEVNSDLDARKDSDPQNSGRGRVVRVPKVETRSGATVG